MGIEESSAQKAGAPVFGENGVLKMAGPVKWADAGFTGIELQAPTATR
jgi:hypothetical protein